MKTISKKEEFLQESLKLIHEKGFKATTMRDIAERLNFDVSNSYNYIKSKQEILESFLFRTSNEFHNSIDNVIASNYGVEDKLKLLISSHIQIASQKPYEVALLVNEWRNLKEPKYTEFVTLRSGYEKKVSDLIKEGIKSKIFKDMDIKIATSVVLASLRWFYDEYTTKDGVSLNPIEFERQIVGYILSGIMV
ncbi:TetR/AcrR family transcriptional regulator [Flavivirga abyssicola]|uniref:TetR/AcrR family transcriptional regulator n=1 Tax=Flavivirga abyssicola TaxID=3063533 RepID=UPI0026DF8631|nr:TetR/AcrR family transcriptional regulator [Flavivirga sp. MEBiC07777]WVK11705.1 TetR/AcrR family transcriptional regulator [Flavivirga sp. MEBiC07777]